MNDRKFSLDLMSKIDNSLDLYCRYVDSFIRYIMIGIVIHMSLILRVKFYLCTMINNSLRLVIRLQFMQTIVSKPLLAIIVVGGSILLLQIVIYELSQIMYELIYLKYVVPFIPPFVITTTAKKMSADRNEKG